MKKMRDIIKLRIVIILFSLPYISAAQTFSIKAGLNYSDMLIKETEIFAPYNTLDGQYGMIPGFHIGAVSELQLPGLFSFETGLILTSAGYKVTINQSFGTENLLINENKYLLFLDIPLSLKYPFSISNQNFYGLAGPYVGIGLTGLNNISSTFAENEELQKETIKWGSEKGVDDLKRFDYGLNFEAGMLLKSFQIGLSYKLGMANLSPESSAGSILSNRVMGVSVGYIFGGSKRGLESADNNNSSEKIQVPSLKSEKTPKLNSKERKAAAIEAEKLRLEKIRTDSIAAVKAEQEKIRFEKIRNDSIESARIIEKKLEAERLEKSKADSISASKKAVSAKAVVYRIQFDSSPTKKGSYNISLNGKNYRTWEYLYKGAYRTTVGEFNTLKDANAFLASMRKAGYNQSFVVAFKNNVRSTDPALFK